MTAVAVRRVRLFGLRGCPLTSLTRSPERLRNSPCILGALARQQPHPHPHPHPHAASVICHMVIYICHVQTRKTNAEMVAREPYHTQTRHYPYPSTAQGCPSALDASLMAAWLTAICLEQVGDAKLKRLRMTVQCRARVRGCSAGSVGDGDDRARSRTGTRHALLVVSGDHRSS
jgi:hypothetical protein